QPPARGVDFGQRARRVSFELTEPPRYLPVEISVGPPEVVEAACPPVERVNAGERVDERVRTRPRRAVVAGERHGHALAYDDSVHRGHEIERRAEHVAIDAARDRLG